MRVVLRRLGLFLLMVLLGFHGAAAEGQYVTINEIREETKDGWHETYDIDGRTLTVDVEIEIPDVAQVPAVRIVFPDDIRLDAPDGVTVVESGATGFNYYLMTSENPIIFEGKRKLASVVTLPEPGALAENSPLTPEEAEALFLRKISPYIDVSALQRDYLIATTRKYEVISMNMSGETLDFSAPATDTGYYDMEYYQTFYGIPYVRTTPPFNCPFNRSLVLERPMGRISGMIATEGDYAVSIYPAAEDGVIAQDLPLVAFSQVKQAFEELILGGYVWAVYFVRLEYVCLDNPDDMGHSFILVPVWEMNCRLVENPLTPDPDALEAAQETPVGGCQDALVNAQTGIYYDPMDSSVDRSTAKLITWEQVD